MKKVKIIREKTGEEVKMSRMDIIGQNGNEGLHYDEIALDAISFITKKYPETTKMFQDMQFEQWELFCKKQKDYGPKNISVGSNLETEEEVKLALTGLWFRMNDKMQRFQQIVMNSQEPENESLMDTFMDLANYAIIAQLVKEKAWGK
jgi:hypothetical protein